MGKMVWLDDNEVDIILSMCRQIDPDDVDYATVDRLDIKLGGGNNGN